MKNNDQSTLALAGFLLQIKAIKLNPAKPFTWASGLKSPIYCDNRITLSYPKIRTHIRQEFVRLILEKYEKPDVIVGVATGGIAQGALVAQELGLPFAYVRSEKKSHGLTNMIEGVVEAGQSIVVIEDLISTGGSSLKAVDALRERGATVKGMMAIFTYGMKAASESFLKSDCELTTLTDFETLLQKAADENYINEDELRSLMEWKMDPKAWSDARI
ncbi:MAG: orotate phosphoribosyltransferase [Bacteroidetes bacterium]|nr:MAG: orotate phosphoribosyltransferase [Bacteroidota bacterium]